MNDLSRAEAILLSVSVFAWFIIMVAVGYFLRRKQKEVISYLKTSYPDNVWRRVLTSDPYEKRDRPPGFAMLTYFYLTEEDLGDPVLRNKKRTLKNIEMWYFGIFSVGFLCLFVGFYLLVIKH